ncbi:MAG: TrkA family potassium uptake protein [Gemmatimonadales bacterium]|jgi:trk system potassium uptake protein TrkA
MRIVIVGTTPEAVMTARLLIERGNEVVMIEPDRSKIDELSDQLDCSFLQGDGTHPELLAETDAADTGVLFCLTDHDQVNILAGLVGQSLGFPRVITSVQDPDFEAICGELGLRETIVPARTISRYLADLVEGLDVLELRTLLKGEGRFFSFTLKDKEDSGKVEGLDLPKGAKVVAINREGEFRLAEPDTRVKEGDEVIVVTHSKHLAELRQRWDPKVASSATKESPDND